MKDLLYHFQNSNDKNIVFGFPNFVHFGDRIAFINVIKNLNLESFKINPGSDGGRELCSYFFDESIFTDEQITHHFHSTPDTLTEAYRCKYVKIKDDEIKRERKYISYAFDCITNVNHKPPYLNELIEKLVEMYGKENVVCIGLHIETGESKLKNTLKYLHESKVFITMDSGMSQLCRTTSTPMIVLEHTNDIERSHPSEYSTRFKGKSLESILEYVSKISNS